MYESLVRFYIGLCVGTIEMSNTDATSPLVPPKDTTPSGKLVTLQVIINNLSIVISQY